VALKASRTGWVVFAAWLVLTSAINLLSLNRGAPVVRR
jgi:hypothetical protein